MTSSRRTFLISFLVPATKMFATTECGCRQAPPERKTFPAHEEQPRRQVLMPKQGFSGKVSNAGEVIEDALVEVFSMHKARRSPVRIVVCVTNDEGGFCIGPLRQGNYEMVISKPGHNAVFYDLTISRGKSGSGRPKLDIPLPLAY